MSGAFRKILRFGEILSQIKRLALMLPTFGLFAFIPSKSSLRRSPIWVIVNRCTLYGGYFYLS